MSAEQELQSSVYIRRHFVIVDDVMTVALENAN
jgi:hypothetical protein